MPINRGTFGKALWPGINKWYGEAYAEYPEEYKDLFATDSDDRAFVEDVGTTGLGLASAISEGAPVTYDTMNQGFVTRYTHVKYGSGFIITSEMIDDDQYMIVAKKRAKALAFSMRQTKETVGANVYNRAFNTSYTGGDGSTLIASAGGGSATHPNVSGGTWTNGPTAAVDLSEAAIEQACIDIGKYTNDRGLKIAVIAQKLIIPIDLTFEASRILDTPLQAFSSENTINALKKMGKLPGGVVVNHYLTDTDAWFIMTNAQDGMKYFERKADNFGEDNDFDTDNLKYKAIGRYSFGWTDPRGLWGSAGV